MIESKSWMSGSGEFKARPVHMRFLRKSHKLMKAILPLGSDTMKPVAVMILIVLEAVLAFLGFFSGGSFLLDPSGESHDMDTTILEGTPVGDFTLVGLFFVTFFGILPVLAIYGLWTLARWRWTDAINRWTGQNWAWTATAATGVTLIVWIAVEVVLIGSPDGFPRFLQVMMTLLGIVILALATLPRVRAYAKFAD